MCGCHVVAMTAADASSSAACAADESVHESASERGREVERREVMMDARGSDQIEGERGKKTQKGGWGG